MRNFLILIASYLLIIVSPLQNNNDEVVSISYQQNDVYDALVVDKLDSEQSMQWYSLFSGMEIYGDKLHYVDSHDFGQIFDKLRLVRDVYGLKESSTSSANKVNNILSKYAEKDFSSTNQSEFVDDLSYISTGFKQYLEQQP